MTASNKTILRLITVTRRLITVTRRLITVTRRLINMERDVELLTEALKPLYFFGLFVFFFFSLYKFSNVLCKGLGAIRAKIGPTSDVDKIFSKMYSQYVLFRSKYS
jgi:hypothetical protein